eukprot:7383734-Prymnesium_polylepis.1
MCLNFGWPPRCSCKGATGPPRWSLDRRRTGCHAKEHGDRCRRTTANWANFAARCTSDLALMRVVHHLRRSVLGHTQSAPGGQDLGSRRSRAGHATLRTQIAVN